MLSTYQRRPTAEAITQRRGSSRTSSSRSDRSKHRYSGTSEFLAQVQLDDDPRTPIQQSVREEFRQHDGVVTILMNYSSRASPKLRYSIIEEYGGRGHRTWLRNRSRGSTCVYGVPLASVYKGWRRGGPALSMARPRGVLLPPGVGLPPSLLE